MLGSPDVEAVDWRDGVLGLLYPCCEEYDEEEAELAVGGFEPDREAATVAARKGNAEAGLT